MTSFFGRLVTCEDLVEAAEPQQRQHLVERVAGQLRVVLPGLHRDRALAVLRGGIEQHVQVVLRIDREAFADRRLQIGMPRFEVCAHRVAPPAHLVPGVRRHVVDVARARDRRGRGTAAQSSRLPRHHRRLRRVHVEVAGAGMMHVLRQDVLQHVVQMLHVRIVDVARAAPRLQQEQRIRVSVAMSRSAGYAAASLLHRLGVGAILLHPLRSRRSSARSGPTWRRSARALSASRRALQATAPSASRSYA